MGNTKQRNRPHVTIYNILFRWIQIKNFSCIYQRLLGMRQSMKMISGLFRMLMPVILEQVMKHPASRRRLIIQS